jgi:hypothetical protein
VDSLVVNRAWAAQLGLTHPLLSDAHRATAKAYGVLYDDPSMVDDPQQIGRYLRCKRAWVVIESTRCSDSCRSCRKGTPGSSAHGCTRGAGGGLDWANSVLWQ